MDRNKTKAGPPRRHPTQRSNRLPLATLLSATVAAVLSACGGGGGGGGGGGIPLPAAVAPTAPAPAPAQPADCTVYLAGDSILAGTSTAGTLERKPADVLRSAGFQVTDAAVTGSTATQSIDRFENTQLTARFIVIEWFTNDVAQGLPVVPPLARAVQHAKASGRTPVMTGAYRYAGTEQQRAEVRELATSTSTPYARWDEIEGERISTTDGHPAQAYSDALAGRLAATLRNLAPECK